MFDLYLLRLCVQYESNDEALNYINEMLSTMRQQMSVFDLGSILIKPVQRILKYPLLLNELIKVFLLFTYLNVKCFKDVKCNNDYSVQNDDLLRGHCTNERRIRKHVMDMVADKDCRQ